MEWIREPAGAARGRALALALALAVGGATLLSACGKAPATMPQGPSAMKVQVLRVAAGAAPLRREAVGRVVARDPVFIMARHDGLRVEKVWVDAGQSVRAGQVLLQLDARALRQERIQAEQVRLRAAAQLAAARSQLLQVASRWRQADDEARRFQAVAAAGAVSELEQRQRQAQLEQAQSEQDAARQSVSAAEAELAAADAALALAVEREGDAVVRAPMAGVVSERRVEVGAVVHAAAGPLFKLARPGDREFEARLDPSGLAGLQPGQPVALTVTPAGQSAPITVEGRIRAVDPALADDSRRGSVRVGMDAWPAGTPLPALGSAATAVLQRPAVAGIPLPATALQFDPAPWVYVVEPDQRIVRRDVGLADDGVTVVAGLAPGETVVRAAGALLTSGQVIDPVLPAEQRQARTPGEEPRT